MALVCGVIVTLALEDMSQVATAIAANNFGALHTKSPVSVPRDCAWHSIEEGRPTAT